MVTEADTMITLPIAGDLTFREWHALIDGVYCGVQDIDTTAYSQEKHYWRMGWLVGDAYDRKCR